MCKAFQSIYQDNKNPKRRKQSILSVGAVLLAGAIGKSLSGSDNSGANHIGSGLELLSSTMNKFSKMDEARERAFLLLLQGTVRYQSDAGFPQHQRIFRNKRPQLLIIIPWLLNTLQTESPDI